MNTNYPIPRTSFSAPKNSVVLEESNTLKSRWNTHKVHILSGLGLVGSGAGGVATAALIPAISPILALAISIGIIVSGILLSAYHLLIKDAKPESLTSEQKQKITIPTFEAPVINAEPSTPSLKTQLLKGLGITLGAGLVLGLGYAIGNATGHNTPSPIIDHPTPCLPENPPINTPGINPEIPSHKGSLITKVLPYIPFLSLGVHAISPIQWLASSNKLEDITTNMPSIGFKLGMFAGIASKIISNGLSTSVNEILNKLNVVNLTSYREYNSTVQNSWLYNIANWAPAIAFIPTIISIGKEAYDNPNGQKDISGIAKRIDVAARNQLSIVQWVSLAGISGTKLFLPNDELANSLVRILSSVFLTETTKKIPQDSLASPLIKTCSVAYSAINALSMFKITKHATNINALVVTLYASFAAFNIFYRPKQPLPQVSKPLVNNVRWSNTQKEFVNIAAKTIRFFGRIGEGVLVGDDKLVGPDGKVIVQNKKNKRKYSVKPSLNSSNPTGNERPSILDFPITTPPPPVIDQNSQAIPDPIGS